MTSKEIVAMAMNRQRPERTPVMCQLANGHTIINTGVHPVDYFTDNDLWSDCLVRMRELYDFDGILCHKPGRVDGIMDLVERTDHDADIPTLFMDDGSRIECTRDDDAYYKPSPEFVRPTLDELDLDNLLSWAPKSFVAFQASKATLPITDPEGFEDHVFGTLDRVIDRVGHDYSVHGEVRAPFDHFLNILGMEEGLMALLDDPERTLKIIERTTDWSIALAVAQIRRGAEAIKISSPFAGSGFLCPDMYEEFILPFEGRLAKAVLEEGKPIYTHTCGAIGDRLDLLCQTGVSGIECLDPPPLGDVDIEEAIQSLNGQLFIKGNVDPVNTLLRGDAAKIKKEVTQILGAAEKMDGFILSSACSVAPPAPPDNMKYMVELCREITDQ
ncbi:MAG: uroporphyrinogen decarboxylase family protein [Verrucomicrobiota bacterium]|nr:uroporphyrinogen decarboxylase family protein [Verrucomicrobiota bacterium]